jgi:predicted O-methyltransferase YrrM
MATWEGKAGTYWISTEAVSFFDVLLKHGANSRFLEIGSFDGIVLSILAEKHPNSMYYALDAFRKAHGTDSGHLDFFLQNTRDLNNVVLLKGLSGDLLPVLGENTFDIIFVDGDHAYEAVKSDVEMSYRLLKKGGVMAMHDYFQIEDTKRAIDEFAQRHRITLSGLADIAWFRK